MELKNQKNVCAKVSFNVNTFVANKFSSHFKDFYYDSCTDIAAVNSFLDLHHDYSLEDQSVPTDSVGSIGTYIHKLKLGKAGGTDDLMTRALALCTPIINYSSAAVIYCRFASWFCSW